MNLQKLAFKVLLMGLFLAFYFTPSALALFQPYITYPTGSWPEAVAIGDVNSDGRNDVVMTTSSYSDLENDYRIFVFFTKLLKRT